MGNRINILLVEDSKFDAELILYSLRKSGIDTTCERVYCEMAMRDALHKQKWDIILSDHLMPSFNSIEALEVRNEVCPEIPFIIVSSCMEEALSQAAFDKGCLASISKSKLDELGEVIKGKLNLS